MSTATPAKASVIVPTYKEADNLRPLTERLFTATRTAGINAELIIVDDNSCDGSVEVVSTLAREFEVRIIVRTNERGLSTAVLRGFEEARADILVVLDADLQHPPEVVPQLIERVASGGCDFVTGTRYAGGGIPGDWPWYRKLASRTATALAKPLAPLSDPMSGLFALPKETWRRAAADLNPLGYKIALELCVKGRCSHIAEVPFTFALRQAGESKFSLREQWLYGRHLLRLYRFRRPVLFWGAALVILFVTISAIAWLARG